MSPQYYKELIKNRRAFHDFSFEDSFKAGIILKGSEVKSVRLGRANFKDAFCRVDKGEIWLYNMHISQYGKGTGFGSPDPDRNRKLLLKKSEIKKITSRINERGKVAIPTKLFIEGDWIKIEIGIGTAKKKYEKREALKRETIQRETRRELHERMK